MFTRNFLVQMAHEHELSKDQKQVFLMRIGDGTEYEQIAQELQTSADACLKRMGQVYRKFNIDGSSRGKENKLRVFLTNKWEELQKLEIIHKAPVIPQSLSSRPQITHQNLPAREYRTFVGRTQEIARLLELLNFQHTAHLISVDGIGGVGKTTLAVEVAYRCLEASQNQTQNREIPTFEAIIFTSAKQSHLTSIGILPRLTRERTLPDICREIARCLDLLEITNLPLEEQFQLIPQKLAQLKTLLIVDNLETVEDKQKVLGFLYDLPPSVKVLITTREQALFVPIRLGCLPREDSLHLIQYEAREKGINLTINEQQKLFEGVSGIPAAMIYAVGRIAAGYLLDDVLAQVKQPEADVARFCFTGSVVPLRGTPSHFLLMALSLAVQSVTRETLAAIAFEEADPINTAQGLASLQQLSLVSQHQGRYSLLALTREYALAELAINSQSAQQLQQRWVSWYVAFSEVYGGTNWKEWHLSYDYLEAEWENLRAVFEWCISKAIYSQARIIWQHIKGYIHVRGYWDERLDWTDWLIKSAKLAGDGNFVVEVMCDRVVTLIRMGQAANLKEAASLLEEAWSLREYQTIVQQLELATNMVILHIHLAQLDQAQHWLEEEQKLLDNPTFCDKQRQEQQVHILYYQGQIYFKKGNYQQAWNILQQALQQAKLAGWQRATAAIQNWLADIALHLGDLNQTKELLELSYPMAQMHKDKRSIAYHQATYARLEKRLGNLVKAERFAKEAAEGFESLKMTTEAQDILSILRTHQNPTETIA